MPLASALLSLLLPLATAAYGGDDEQVVQHAKGADRTLVQSSLSASQPEWIAVPDASTPPIANQVRIERRVILRINPQPSRARGTDLLAQLPRRATPARLVEQSMDQCLPASNIVGVSDSGSRLIIYMRDRGLISAQLEKACSPRDFYLGFYVERNADGQLCADRDRLMSRAGAKCRISEFNRLVAVRPRD